MVSVFIVAAAAILEFIAVPAAARAITSGAAAATFLIFLMLLALAFLLLVEASGHLVEPAVRDLVRAVHDTAQHQLLHLGRLVSRACLLLGGWSQAQCRGFVFDIC